MTTKVGPYGSHYGHGCYTKNCSLRHAADAGVNKPTSYEDADNLYKDAHARYMTAKGASNVRSARASVEKAKLKRSATPEGLKELKKNLAKTKGLFGATSPAAFINEEELQQAQNLHDKQESEFKTEVFQASPKVLPRDIKSIVEHSTRYDFDKTTGIVTDKRTKTALAKLTEDGSLHLSVNGKVKVVAPSEVEDYATAKNMIATKITEDVNSSLASRPTLTTKIVSTLKNDYNLEETTKKPDGSFSVLIRDKTSKAPLAIIKYDKDSTFSHAEWSSPRNDGSLTWPEKSAATVLHMLKEDKFGKIPPLPEWVKP